MVLTALDSPLLRMTQETPTEYWNDSCAAEELDYAIERGATGATSNPTIVLDVMRKERELWAPRVLELALTQIEKVFGKDSKKIDFLEPFPPFIWNLLFCFGMKMLPYFFC